MDSSSILGIVVFFLFVIFNIMMYGFSSAVKNLNESDVEKDAENGIAKSKKLFRIIEKPERFVNTIQLTTTTFAIVVGGFQCIYFANKLHILLGDVTEGTIAGAYARIIATVIVMVFMLIILLSIGVMVPKKLGLKYSKFFAYSFVNIVDFFMCLLLPLTALIEGISNIMLRLCGIDPKETLENVTEEEIISIVNEGHEQGILEEREVEMISNIIELDDKKAGDIMTHRKSIVAVDGEFTLEQAVDFMLDANNSRFPVFLGDIDNIIAIVHLRDAVECLHKAKKYDHKIKDIDTILREARFIPESKNIDSLFKEMQQEKIHMEIVVDEYGQTAGIVAMEDILEEIVGNILDEYDEEDTNIVKQSENVYFVKGMTTLEQIEEELEIQIDDDDNDTLNGYLISKLDRIPSEEDKIVIDEKDVSYEILAVENKMISLVKVRLHKVQEEETIVE